MEELDNIGKLFGDLEEYLDDVFKKEVK